MMIHKKIIFSLSIFCFLAGCTAPTAMLAPAYTLSSTGSVMQAGLSYGSNEMITMYTGKTPMENVVEMTSIEKNIQKQTLESEDFHILVKNKINKTGAILKGANQ
tara:strand:- start:1439 stop:1753 length:315 start_codon:yes stop_codon:yes gene_type:complete